MCNKNQLEEIIEKIVAFSKEIFGDEFHSVVLYGSYARGDYDSESDIDVMIMIDKSREELVGYRRIVNDLCTDIDLDYNVVITPKLQSVSFFEEWKNTLPFYQNIIKDGVAYV